METKTQSSNDTDISDDEPLMVDNQTQTSNQVLEEALDTNSRGIHKGYSIN